MKIANKVDQLIWKSNEDDKRQNRNHSRRFSMSDIISEEMAKVDDKKEKERELKARNRKTLI